MQVSSSEVGGDRYGSSFDCLLRESISHEWSAGVLEIDLSPNKTLSWSRNISNCWWSISKSHVYSVESDLAALT